MSLRTILSRSAVATGMAVMALVTQSQPAAAQSQVFFLWGGEQEWGGGRQSVAFHSQYKPGQIVDSFSDRRH
jgi:hypothetical protein